MKPIIFIICFIISFAATVFSNDDVRRPLNRATTFSSEHVIIRDSEEDKTQKRSFFLTENKYYFRCPRAHLPVNSFFEIKTALRRYKSYETLCASLFDIDIVYNLHWKTISLPAWAVIYANAHYIDDKIITDMESPQYLLGLICSGEYEKAEKTGLKIYEEDKDNYGIIILLGILSQQNKELFSFLEKAFSMNSAKTLFLVDWQTNMVEIKVKPENEWDFLDSWLRLLFETSDILFHENVDSLLLNRLEDAIKYKYYDDNGKNIIPAADDIKPKIQKFEERLRQRATDLMQKHVTVQ